MAKQQIIRSRAIRRASLEILAELHEAMPGMAMEFEDLSTQISTASAFAVGAAELQGELVYLRDKGLVEIDQGHVRIVANGVDFRRAGMPWDAIDSYSGK